MPHLIGGVVCPSSFYGIDIAHDLVDRCRCFFGRGCKAIAHCTVYRHRMFYFVYHFEKGIGESIKGRCDFTYLIILVDSYFCGKISAAFRNSLQLFFIVVRGLRIICLVVVTMAPEIISMDANSMRKEEVVIFLSKPS